MKTLPKKQVKLSKKTEKTPLFQPVEIIYGIIILAYIFIPTFTPNWMSLDTNTPKFFMTALLNLVLFLYFIASGYFRKNPAFYTGFFTNPVGLVYSALLGVTLLSFTQAVNHLESVLQFTKVFTVFASAFNIAMILMHDLRYMRLIIIVMAGLLAFDSISVFADINKFIEGEIKAITDIKTVYSNKNILASAIFVKLPFALFLLVFEKKWLKLLGWITFTMGVAATFFMATRAFYLGLSVLSVAFVGYHLAVYLRNKNLQTAGLAGAYLVSLILAYGLFTFTQSNLYPQAKKSRHTEGVIEQMATLRNPESASSLRVDAWRWSLQLIKEKPLLGVGTGNWKVEILKLENQKNPGFIYLYKTHNDFIEITTETGIFGGLLFLSIFVLIVWNFLKRFIHKKDEESAIGKYMFIAAGGVAFYSVDAMFNFPADRPEITALFAFFVATGIASAFYEKNAEKSGQDLPKPVEQKNLIWLPVSALGIAFLAASAWILYLNFQSSKTQRIVYQEIMGGKLKEPSEKILAGFPYIPDVSVWGESIATLKARYLINEEKHQQAIDMLRYDFSSPWDARREFFTAMAYNNMNEYDSALYYSELAYHLKPNYFRNVQLLASLYEKKKEDDKAMQLYDKFLDKNKKESQAWLFASNVYIKNEDYEKADELINEALQYNKHDTLIQKQQRFLKHKLRVEPYLPKFNQAAEFYQNKKYPQALALLNDFLEKVPDHSGAYQIRSYCHYYLKDYPKSIADADRALEIGPPNASLINLRGVCKLDLKDKEGACQDFLKAMNMGDKSAKTNHERFCVEKQ